MPELVIGNNFICPLNVLIMLIFNSKRFVLSLCYLAPSSFGAWGRLPSKEQLDYTRENLFSRTPAHLAEAGQHAAIKGQRLQEEKLQSHGYISQKWPYFS